ncbi:MAG: hypothetical protein KC457_13805, partial [Myxococcales bacterium]|nr:hypothetical protein [Myxococcales bacterium]
MRTSLRGLLAALALLPACGEAREQSSDGPPQPVEPAAKRDADRKIPVALHGCTAIATGSGPVRCLLSKPKPLALWIGTRKHPSTVSVTLDGTPIDA